jgi:hypothetical protein
MKPVAIILTAIALTGCATGQQYQAYAEAHKAQAAAQSARYQALADIAKMGDTTAKVAAVISLQAGSQQQQSQIVMPRSASDQALQWASILVPAVSQAYMIGQNVKLGMRQSDNAAEIGISTNNAFVGMAGNIQAPAANVSTVSNTSNSSTIGANSGANSGNTATTRTASTSTNTVGPNSGANSGNTSSTSSTATIGPNSGQNSGNSGRLAGTSITDNTSTPTVVTQPAPVVVNQPAPITVTQPAPVIVPQPAPIVVRPEVVQPVVIPPTPVVQ